MFVKLFKDNKYTKPLYVNSDRIIAIYEDGYVQAHLATECYFWYQGTGSQLIGEISGGMLFNKGINPAAVWYRGEEEPAPAPLTPDERRALLVKACAKDRVAVDNLLAKHNVARFSQAAEETQLLIIEGLLAIVG